jgi:hypothetical protein
MTLAILVIAVWAALAAVVLVTFVWTRRRVAKLPQVPSEEPQTDPYQADLLAGSARHYCPDCRGIGSGGCPSCGGTGLHRCHPGERAA